MGRALAAYGIGTDRSSDPETAITRMQQQKFDALVVDFDDADAAYEILEQAQKLGLDPIGIALLADPSRVRDVLNAKAHFVVYKPVSGETATAALRAVAALLKQERRGTVRIPVQAPVEITLADGRTLDGILLDLSVSGMDVLMAEPQAVGALFSFHFRLAEGSVEINSTGRVAWANPNGQTGVHFPDMDESTRELLKNWLNSAATILASAAAEPVTQCKLTDLSAGGCYLETGSPFPEKSLIDLCLKTDAGQVHAEGMVRVVHPGHGMGVEFPSRTEDQRARVLEVFDFLRANAGVTPEFSISPLALVADASQFEHDPLEHVKVEDDPLEPTAEEWDDPLLDLLRRGSSLDQGDFLGELGQQRNPQAAGSSE